MSFSDIAARMREHAAEHAEEEKPTDFEEIYKLRARILGVLIRDARFAANMTVEDCAAKLGVDPATFEQWELGLAMPSLPQIEVLAYTLGMPISHFWGSEMLEEQGERQPIDPHEYVNLRNRLIGALLRAAREQANLTQEQLAEAAGVPTANVAAYELGQRPIPTPVLSSLASACSVNLSYFLENGNKVGTFLLLQEDMQAFSNLPEEVRHFVASPTNLPYIELTMKIARMGTTELRSVAEARPARKSSTRRE
jgi:transcriptional regulator with XRE-family HTH domain